TQPPSASSGDLKGATPDAVTLLVGKIRIFTLTVHNN
ncbi:hypothetical protein A2U01_0072243, partial [Trifolium medium]|nr:hypothetical protein [Trifolium medium]